MTLLRISGHNNARSHLHPAYYCGQSSLPNIAASDSDAAQHCKSIGDCGPGDVHPVCIDSRPRAHLHRASHVGAVCLHPRAVNNLS